MMTTSPISSPRPTRFKFTKKHSPAEPPASPTVNMDDDDDSSSLTSIDVIPCAEDASVEDICEQLCSGVRFDEYADVHEIDHINDFSDSLVGDVWLTPEELDDAVGECLDTVKEYDDAKAAQKNGKNGSSESKLPTSDDTRGLELYLKEHSERRERNRTHAYKAVFGMQARHRREGVQDDADFAKQAEKLAGLYKRFTADAKLEAEIAGRQDAKVAKSLRHL